MYTLCLVSQNLLSGIIISHWMEGNFQSYVCGMYSQTKKCTTVMLLCIFFKWLCQMLFGQYGVKFFHNIIGKLKFLR